MERDLDDIPPVTPPGEKYLPDKKIFLHNPEVMQPIRSVTLLVRE